MSVDPSIAALIDAMKLQNDAMQQQNLDLQKQVTKLLTHHVASVTPSSSSTSVPQFEAYRKNEKFKQYRIRFEQHLSVYCITDKDRKRALFLASIGPETFTLLQNLFGTHEDLTCKDYSDLVAKLEEHFETKVHVLSARHKFYSCHMKKDQTYEDWVAELRGLAVDCKFTCPVATCAASYSDEIIRDQLIKESPHAEIRHKCLLETRPSLPKVLEIAQLYVQTAETDKLIKGGGSPPDTPKSPGPQPRKVIKVRPVLLLSLGL